MRSVTKTSTKINAMQTVFIFRSMLAALRIEGSTDLPVVKSKRNMPRHRDRVQSNWNEAPAGYYPDECIILELIDEVSLSV